MSEDKKTKEALCPGCHGRKKYQNDKGWCAVCNGTGLEQDTKDHAPGCPFEKNGNCACWLSDTKEPDTKCVFCAKFANEPPMNQVMSFEPLNPVVPGHRLFIHRYHTRDAGEVPGITAQVMQAASEYAQDQASVNIITSKGTAATQSVFHLHIHVVPRKENDGLALPWTGQDKATAALSPQPKPQESTKTPMPSLDSEIEAYSKYWELSLNQENALKELLQQEKEKAFLKGRLEGLNRAQELLKFPELKNQDG